MPTSSPLIWFGARDHTFSTSEPFTIDAVYDAVYADINDLLVGTPKKFASFQIKHHQHCDCQGLWVKKEEFDRQPNCVAMAASRRSRRREMCSEPVTLLSYSLWLCMLVIIVSCIGATYAVAYPGVVNTVTRGVGGAADFDTRPQSTVARRGFDIHGRIRIEDIPTVKASRVKVLLDGGERVTFLKQEGFFSFSDVPVGIHLLEVVAMGYMFMPIRVDVSPRYEGQTRAMWNAEIPQVQEGSMVLQPLQAIEYYEKREPFSLSGMLKNPMVLMVLFMGVSMFLLPKLVENMDPEAMRELQQDTSQQPAMTKMVLGKDN